MKNVTNQKFFKAMKNNRIDIERCFLENFSIANMACD